jgi:putative Mn2+ efflux pump MntP
VYERKNQALLPRKHFIRRVLRHGGVASVLTAMVLFIGMVGYHSLAHLSWIDSFLNASMILSGMGPVDPLETSAAKLFGGAYALFSGVVFIAIAGVIVAPFAHRLIHRFHVDDK